MSTRVEAVFSRSWSDERELEFRARVAESQHRVFQVAYSVLANAADAEEVAQEAFIKAYRKFGRLRDPNKFNAWINRIVFRLALNQQRARRRRIVRDTAWQTIGRDPVVDGARHAQNQLFLDRLRNEIDRLPEKLRSVLLMCAVEEMQVNEIAALLEIPAGTVRSRLHLARKRLLGALER